jgi:energy-coupling factor transporter ATP-binding protein EcfA2
MANAIARVEIKDFLVFKGEFAADFCPGVNILIGGNGTGKTTLMKAMYAVARYPSVIDRSCYPYDMNRNVEIIDYFSERNDTTDKYSHVNSGCEYPYEVKKCQITFGGIEFGWEDKTDELECKTQDKNDKGSVNLRSGYWYYCSVDLNDAPEINAVFITAEEMLSHANGLLALNEKYTIPFDRTQIDVLWNASLPDARNIAKPTANILDKITGIIKGTVVVKNGTFYVAKDDPAIKALLPFSLEASGFRKFALLWKLLRNGLLENGSVLFWDEPESSVNPELIPTLIDIMLELQRDGVQIFVATHSYAVARWFELRKTDKDELRYFNMSKGSNGIEVTTAGTYTALSKSVLRDADDNLLKAVVGYAMGVTENAE